MEITIYSDQKCYERYTSVKVECIVTEVATLLNHAKNHIKIYGFKNLLVSINQNNPSRFVFYFTDINGEQNNHDAALIFVKKLEKKFEHCLVVSK